MHVSGLITQLHQSALVSLAPKISMGPVSIPTLGKTSSIDFSVVRRLGSALAQSKPSGLLVPSAAA